jgi:hypothetical protein
VAFSYCAGLQKNIALGMTQEKRTESNPTDDSGSSASVRARVEALQEKVSRLNETLDDTRQTLQEASDDSGDASARG